MAVTGTVNLTLATSSLCSASGRLTPAVVQGQHILNDFEGGTESGVASLHEFPWCLTSIPGSCVVVILRKFVKGCGRLGAWIVSGFHK